MDQRLARMEDRIERNETAIRRALAVIAARMGGDGS